MTIALLDDGNTRLKLSRLQPDGRHGTVLAIAHAQADFGDRLESALREFGPLSGIWLASSRPPQLSDRLVRHLSSLAPLRNARVEDGVDGLCLAYAEPQRLGVDRYLAMLAARQRSRAGALVVLVGTAMTIDALAPDGHHLGGLILPSPARMRAALSRDAAHLPVDGGSLVDFAGNTRDALHSGCLLAAISLLERSVARLRAEYCSGIPLLLAGGGAAELAAALAVPADLVPDLVLEGLARWGHAVAPQ